MGITILGFFYKNSTHIFSKAKHAVQMEKETFFHGHFLCCVVYIKTMLPHTIIIGFKNMTCHLI